MAAVLVEREHELDVVLGGVDAPAVAGTSRRVTRVDLFGGVVVLACLAELEQFVDRPCEPIDLAHADVQLLAGAGRERQHAGFLDAQSQPGQWRTQLVGGVGDELLLAADKTRETHGHVVERPRQRPLLAAAANRRERVRVAGGDAARDSLQPSQTR